MVFLSFAVWVLVIAVTGIVGAIISLAIRRPASRTASSHGAAASALRPPPRYRG